ncbi:Acetylornithine deacetylase [Citrus sinensis]|uniref:Acetylornithine deacetylase n=1 Tax=Citrus sinensis TaxID=2711 RepID=A0ACB8L828_CITSI|nr:Acetylornithine deacetylase [Citrus sinensis]
MASSVVKETLGTLNKDSYVNLLSKLIGESRYVQNNPPELIPQEDRVVKHVLDALLPLSTKTGGGPLVINHITYFTGRGNLIVEYPGTEPGKILSFVGMHMDVVTANPNEWVCLSFLMLFCADSKRFYINFIKAVHVSIVAISSRCRSCAPIDTRSFLLKSWLPTIFIGRLCEKCDGKCEFDPFSLSIDGEKLCGRGTTDCLGHVALVTELMRKLGETKLKLKSTVIAVFIASEENSAITGVGVDALVKDGLLNKLKGGPLYWIDTADKQPCIGTGGMIPWKLHVTGKLFHSGLPHKAINPLELAMEALKVIQTRFYKDFPPHPKEQVYGFETPSTMKPTQWSYPGGGINQIPGECTVSGDVRLTPFYNVTDVMKRLQEYVDDINENIEKLDTRGPVSKYVLPDENIRGRHVLSLRYLTLGRDDFRILPLSLTLTFDEATNGVACNLDSRGFHVLCKATEEVVGHVNPYSITGTLPLIREIQDEGFDVQTAGYGLMATYHADNEYCLLSDMCQGYQVFVSIISQLED